MLVSKHRVAELYNYPDWQRALNVPMDVRERNFGAFGFEVEQAFEEALLFRRKVAK